ncbi:MAG: hypothetical protein KatS3mg068_2684 [Candidatus Sericytochromatia bacterium]|nr:MAG: hypothetical protein KatS3mg068_2684 [Candidatus Sericytochromatia bacterium]
MENQNIVNQNFLDALSDPENINHNTTWEILLNKYKYIFFTQLNKDSPIKSYIEIFNEFYLYMSENDFKYFKNFDISQTNNPDGALGDYIRKILITILCKKYKKINKEKEVNRLYQEILKLFPSYYGSEEVRKIVLKIEEYIRELLNMNKIKNIDYIMFGLYLLDYSLEEITEIIYKDYLQEKDYELNYEKYLQRVKNHLYRLIREKIKPESEKFLTLIEKN